jgi:hypothetical protein
MTVASGPEPLEAFPIPEGAIVLRHGQESGSHRELAVAALQQAMAERRLALPLGPQLDLANPERLLTLNRFALQLVSGGFLADQLAVEQSFWRDAATAPQLLLAALVDEENGVVQLQGVLTGPELQQQLAAAEQQDGCWLLEPEAFRGGIERLFTLVQLLEPEALPRLALAGDPLLADRLLPVVRIVDWLQGQVDQALLALGAELQPATAAAFRSAAGAMADGSALTVLAIPLGLNTAGELVSGDAARRCIETFQLLLAPTTAGALVLRLTGALEGDLLPDGLSLRASQGSHRQSATTAQSSVIEFSFHGSEPISVELSTRQGSALQLPPLVLQRP